MTISACTCAGASTTSRVYRIGRRLLPGDVTSQRTSTNRGINWRIRLTARLFMGVDGPRSYWSHRSEQVYKLKGAHAQISLEG